jgi:hypothetical protein
MLAQAIQDGDLIGRSKSVVGADAIDAAILIDIDSGYFFELNKTASRIWALVEQPIPLVDLCTELGKRFKVRPETCRADVAEFVADMRERGLLTVAAA